MKVYIPINFPKIDYLVYGSNLKADKIRVLLHQMYLSRLSQSGYTGKQKQNVLNYFFDEGYIGLNSTLLKLLLSSNYKRYINLLIENNLLVIRESAFSKKAYSIGFASMHYKLPNRLFHIPGTYRHFRNETITDKRAIKAVLKTRDEFKSQSSKSVRSIQPEAIHEILFDMEKSVRFNIEDAQTWVMNHLKEEFNSQNYSQREEDKIRGYQIDEIELIDSINEGMFNAKVDQFGERLHSPLKRVSRRMRPFMHFEGNKEELMCLDISNSQLYFITLLLNDKIVNSIIPEFNPISEFSSQFKDKDDFKEFITTAIDGSIYTNWQAKSNLQSREAAKSELIMILFASKNIKMPSAVLFKNTFPSVWGFFDKIKSLNENKLPFIRQTYLDSNGYYKVNSLHCNLSCAVQRLESRIFIKRIGQALIDNGIKPFFTIHDSVYFPKSFTEKVQQIILNEFKALNVTPPKLKLSTP